MYLPVREIVQQPVVAWKNLISDISKRAERAEHQASVTAPVRQAVDVQARTVTERVRVELGVTDPPMMMSADRKSSLYGIYSLNGMTPAEHGLMRGLKFIDLIYHGWSIRPRMLQKPFVDSLIHAHLPMIMGSESWAVYGPSLTRTYGWPTTPPITVVCSMARKVGKTSALSIVLASLACVAPGRDVMAFAKVMRASKRILGEVKQYISERLAHLMIGKEPGSMGEREMIKTLIPDSAPFVFQACPGTEETVSTTTLPPLPLSLFPLLSSADCIDQVPQATPRRSRIKSAFGRVQAMLPHVCVIYNWCLCSLFHELLVGREDAVNGIFHVS